MDLPHIPDAPLLILEGSVGHRISFSRAFAVIVTAAKFLPPSARRLASDYRASSCDSFAVVDADRGLDGGCVGPDPTPSRSIVAAISSRSPALSSRVAAPIQPSICAGDLAPTIAPVTPGHARVQATATAATVVSWRFAIGASASRSPMFFSRRGV